MTRILFAILLVCVIAIYVHGQGWIGTRPVDEGRDRLKSTQEVQPDSVQVLPRAAKP